MHSVAQRQDITLMEFPPHAQAHRHGHHAPRRHNTTALDTQNIDIHASHMRVNSLSSKGSLSDYSTLRTPQDLVASDNEALIKQQDDSNATNGWKANMALQDQLTSSPVEEVFPGRAPGKPMQMHINTSFQHRSRPVPFSAHPNQKSMATSQLPAPQSATAAFPPMQLPSVAPSSNANIQPAPHSIQTVPHPNELPDVPVQRPGQNQAHRRTKSAPLLSLSPIASPSSIPLEQPIPPPNNANFAAGARSLGRSSYPPQELALAPPSYQQVNPMAQGELISYYSHSWSNQGHSVAAPPFPAFPSLNPFPTAMPNVPQTVPSLMWPGFFTPPAPSGNFYTPRPPPQLASPASTIYSPPAQPVQPAPPTQWKINPNSQPQMPLSHLISQAQGMVVGGPSAHNRKIGLYKTEICRNWEEKQSCRYGVKCQFAHGTTDVRIVPRHPKYKTEICRTFWVTGSCPYGKRCCFIHPTQSGSNPMVNMGMMNMPVPNTGNGRPSVDDADTQHAISLLARLDLKKNSPEGTNARQTPDSNTSDGTGFVYPGMNGHPNGIDVERSGSGARI
ncbi:hypothetical protein FRC14_004278 [Serendipita sp. 396]|nr:hypothetical protein FRC14_004278 [Serendipita sp. 396]KAG8800413.1 hypothetical protein FRC16_002933 [Serendipita sp. 398]KAG8824752.1 hypothetical protein FRC19_001113 [Serendipita sp. 401]KAG8853617.1 hypothetical protein FRB91_004625 [Serendipita sp. 411]